MCGFCVDFFEELTTSVFRNVFFPSENVDFIYINSRFFRILMENVDDFNRD